MAGIDQKLPLTSLTSVLFASGCFVALWMVLSRYVDKKGGFSWAETILDAHNFLLAITSLVLGAYVLDIGHNILDAKTGYQVDPYLLGYFYHLLKVYEYLDVILLILSGNTKISKSTAWSKLALPIVSYYRIVGRPHDSLDWRLHVIADCGARFLSRAVPRLIEDVKVAEAILNTVEEGRWYGDLAINFFWGSFVLQGQRDSDQAIKIFGKSYKDEGTARLLSIGLLLYAIFAKRQEDTEKARAAETKKQRVEASQSTQAKQDRAIPSTQQTIRKTSRRKQ